MRISDLIQAQYTNKQADSMIVTVRDERHWLWKKIHILEQHAQTGTEEGPFPCHPTKNRITAPTAKHPTTTPARAAGDRTISPVSGLTHQLSTTIESFGDPNHLVRIVLSHFDQLRD
jgi:hypothetical protein